MYDYTNQINALNQIGENLIKPMPVQSEAETPNILLKDSAIKSGWNRVRWGVADDSGKIDILRSEGYSPNPNDPNGIVRLKNGEFGVKTQYGVKPVDPKGFQFADLGGDIAESIGKSITMTGGILGALVGAGVGSVPLAIAGAMGGETIRQGIGIAMGVRNPANEGKLFYTDQQGNLKIGGAGEVLAEGALAGGSQKLANYVVEKFAQAGAVRPAVSALDDLIHPDEPIETRLIDMQKRNFGFKPTASPVPLQESLPGGRIYGELIPTDERAMDAMGYAGEKAVTLGNAIPQLETKLFKQGLNEAGYDTSKLMIPAQDEFGQIITKVRTLGNDSLSNGYNDIISKMKVGLSQGTGTLNYDTIAEITDNARNIRDMAWKQFDNGVIPYDVANKTSEIANLLGKAKNSDTVMSKLNKTYGEVAQAGENIAKTLRLAGKDGKLIEGYRGTAGIIKALGTEAKGPRLTKLLKNLDIIEPLMSKTEEFKDLPFSKTMLKAMLADHFAEAKKASTLSFFSPVQTARAVGQAVYPARVRWNALKGIMQTTKIDPSTMSLPVNRILKDIPGINRLATLGKLAGAMNLPGVTQKGISVGGQSLNEIMYRNTVGK